MQINVNKSEISVLSKKREPPNVAVMFGNNIIPHTNSATHMDVYQTSNMKCKPRIETRCQKAKQCNQIV